MRQVKSEAHGCLGQELINVFVEIQVSRHFPGNYLVAPGAHTGIVDYDYYCPSSCRPKPLTWNPNNYISTVSHFSYGRREMQRAMGQLFSALYTLQDDRDFRSARSRNERRVILHIEEVKIGPLGTSEYPCKWARKRLSWRARIKH